MALLERLGASWTLLGTVLIGTVGVYVAVIALTRLSGVRSLAKMSSFDVAATVAVGSAVASTALGSMAGPQLVEADLRHAGVSPGEVWAALRQAGVLRREDVRAVVLETTGDLSVLSGDGRLDDELLDGVRGGEHVA